MRDSPEAVASITWEEATAHTPGPVSRMRPGGHGDCILRVTPDH